MISYYVWLQSKEVIYTMTIAYYSLSLLTYLYPRYYLSNILIGGRSVTLASYSTLLIPYCHKKYYKYRRIVLPPFLSVPSPNRNSNLFSPPPLRFRAFNIFFSYSNSFYSPLTCNTDNQFRPNYLHITIQIRLRLDNTYVN